MSTTKAQTPTLPKGTIFKLLNHAKTKREGLKIMDEWVAKQKAKGSRRQVTEVTKSLFNVLVSRILPASLEYLAEERPEEWKKCQEKDEYYLFTTVPSIRTILSGGKKHLRRCKKCIYSNIMKLIEIGVLTMKVNHRHTGIHIPLPNEEQANGRGKFKLVFAVGLVHIRGGQRAPSDQENPSFFAYKEETLPQYKLSKDSSISIENRVTFILNTNHNTSVAVDKVALPVGKSIDDMENRGRASKLAPTEVPNVAPENFRQNFSLSTITDEWKDGKIAPQEDKVSRELWRYLHQEWYDGKRFNEEVQETVMLSLQIHLETAKQAVLDYKRAEIKRFKESTIFLQAKRKERLLIKLQKRLPSTELGAIEIVGHAISKHKKNRAKKNDTIGFPTHVVYSKGFEKALELSATDWTRIKLQYFNKNEKSRAWAEAIQLINGTYAKRVLEAAQRGPNAARATGKQILSRWLIELREESHLTPEKKEELKELFINRIKSL